ncbi:hypothetical protein RZA67_13650 [Stenotrophomonas sp. C3(2023)]|uniref:hypothetical protein n=1 Tax=Stenotrophomonas sp. C3(2023) TaxID=3080277 RepID=UPI00293C29C5|nr:hypothetical protein [Stenotrophomonas sp. C3(2023)]MDV3469763.1 hypothetical protein [Stenotrophomonas sp. C3(2023)]
MTPYAIAMSASLAAGVPAMRGVSATLRNRQSVQDAMLKRRQAESMDFHGNLLDGE